MNAHGPYCHPNGVRSYGDASHGVVLLGISPGRNEMREGRPFIGESGRLLDAILDAVGWARDKVYTTNLYCQHNDEPTPAMIAGCAPRLRQEINTIKPKVLVTLGKLATEQVIPTHTFGKVSGGVFWTENVLGSGHSCYVIPTFHPAAILYGMSMYVHDVYRDLRRIKTVLEWEPGAPHTKVNYKVIESTREAQSALNSFANIKPPYLALDIESAQGKDADESFDPHSDKLLCVGISDGEYTVVIPEEFCHGLRWPTELNWCMHFSQFDYQGIRRFLGASLAIRHDTLLMSYLCDERSGVHALKSICREQLGVGFYEDTVHNAARKLKSFESVDRDDMYEYNAKDAAYTARVAPLLYQQMIDDDVLWPYHNLLIPAVNAFSDIQYRGMKVDPQQFNVLRKRWFTQWMSDQTALVELGESFGAASGFNPNSHIQLKRLVFDILKLKPAIQKVSEKTGALSLDREVLESLEGQHPFIEALSNYRGLDKIVSNYLLPLGDHIKLDGNLHATTKLHGTTTGRTSYINPALQTIPNSKYSSNAKYADLRSIFVPHNSDTHIIAEFDFSKIELFWAVYYSGDETMRADLASGDFHSRTAADIFHKPLSEVTPWDRTRGKHLSFGLLYGRGARALAKGELQCGIAEAEVFVARWKMRYRTYMEWAEKQRALAMSQGELVSISKRKRRFKIILPEDFEMLNQAVNHPVQSAASDTTMAALIKLHPMLREYDSYILLMIHDSLVCEVSKQHQDIVLLLIKQTMEAPQFEGWPRMEVEGNIGPNWQDQYKIIDVEDYELVTA